MRCLPAALLFLPATVAAATQVYYTLADSELNATFRGGSAAQLGTLSYLAASGGGGRGNNVIADGVASYLWSARFVGDGLGDISISSSTASCAGTTVAADARAQVTFRWSGCMVRTPGASIAVEQRGGAVWIEHNNSNCGGTCLPEKSKAGNCDRQPGCGHHPHGGSANCSVSAMKSRCLSAPGCTAFNTNGYLYQDTSIKPFRQYPLQCYTLGGVPPPPPPVVALVNVSVTVTLSRGMLEYSLAFDGDGTVSLWAYTISLPNIATTLSTITVQTKAAGQMLGFYQKNGGSGAGAVYFAAHDPAWATKSCTADASPEQGTGTLQCAIMAVNASLPLYHYTTSYPVVVTVIRGGDWWDISQVYRMWVLPNSHWTQLGTLEDRAGRDASSFPDWLENVTLWVNNNHGSDPLKPLWGGDPTHVKLEMLKLNALLGLPAHGGQLAVHWYEWDLLGYAPGSNYTKCDRHPAPCGFDTHYPEYLPARPGCKGAVAAMKEQGMRVIPYINGQLFDILLPKYTTDGAEQYTAKLSHKTINTEAHHANLTVNMRSFDHISDAVMCPATTYWQAIMRDTMLSIVNDLGFDGVYVDQEGVEDARTIADHHCMDPTHNHATIGGGSYWTEAYYSIMTAVRAGVNAPSMFMTEGTVEEMQGPAFDTMLGLDWTELPYWHAIYGGYGYATGHATSGQPLSSGGLLEQLTDQFMVGGTMGWFTYETYGDQFFLPANAPKVDYIRRLSEARIVAKNWMVHGRATRSLVLVGNTTDSLKAGCFLRDGKSAGSPSVVCAVASPKESVLGEFSFALHPSRFGLAVPEGVAVHLTDLVTGASYGMFRSVVTYSGSLPEFGIALFKLTVKP